jgi:large conductance mechanosensitive channel
MSIVKEFKDFAANGNFIDLAIGVLIGGAFGPVVGAFVKDFILAIVSAIFGQPSFDEVLAFDLNGTRVRIGTTITALFSFLIIMLVAFFILKAIAKMKKPADAAAAGPSEVDLLTEIRDSLRAR